MSDTPKLGQLIQGEAQRDAVHIAIAPVVAATALQPGLPVGLDEQGRAACNVAKHVGVVDPFLKTTVKEGQRFYLFLFPNTVTGMRHEWQHPAFPELQKPDNGVSPESKAAAEAWLKEFADDIDLGYSELIDVLTRCQERGDWHTFHRVSCSC
jgi:hypothetical protein